MALADNHHQRATSIGRRTWFCTGTTLVVMGMVAMATELVLQQKLNRSKFGESGECVSQSVNVKVGGIWCGIPIVFYGLLTISVGVYRSKAMMILLALLSVLYIMFALALLLITEVSIVSSYNLNRRRTEADAGPQLTTAGRGDPPFLRFSPSHRTLERNSLSGDHGPNSKMDGRSSTMDNNNDHNMKYQHEPGKNSGYRQVGVSAEKTEERRHGMDRGMLNLRISRMKALNEEHSSYEQSGFGEELDNNDDENRSSGAADEPKIYDDDVLYDSELEEGEGNKTPAKEQSSEDKSGGAADEPKIYDDYVLYDSELEEGEGNKTPEKEQPSEDRFEEVSEEQREKDDYDLYNSELVEGESNQTAEEQSMYSIFWNWCESSIRGIRKKRDLGNDCPEEEEITRQRLFQLMSCLMAVVGVIVLVLSIVLATLIFAPFCCFQTDKTANAQQSSQMQSAKPDNSLAGKDDISLWSDDTTLLQA